MKKLIFISVLIALFSCQKEQNIINPIPQDAPILNRVLIANCKANTIQALKDSSLWNNLTMLQVRVDTNQTFALTDWIDTTRVASISGTVTFYVNGGIKGNGTTGKINTNYNPYGSSVFLQDNNSFGVYVANRVIENKSDMSAMNYNNIQSISTSPSLYCYDNSSTVRTTANDIGRGFMACKRTSSTIWTSTVGGYIGTQFTDNSTAIPNLNFYEFCKNVNGTYSAYTTRTHYYIFAGSGNLDLYKFNCIMEKFYLIPLGLCPTKRLTFSGDSYIANREVVQQTMLEMNDYNNLDLNVSGTSGYTTLQVDSCSARKIYAFKKDYLTDDEIIVWCGTNDMASTSGNVDSTYNRVVRYLRHIKTAMPNMKIFYCTMMPRTGQTHRQNDADLYDATTLNGRFRNDLENDVVGVTLCDPASDSLIGKNGQNTDSRFFKTDWIHLNTAGANRATKYYIKPKL